MKIAVLSDVHGNVPALEAVLEDIERWGPDEVIVNGDLIGRGPCSLACLRMLLARQPDAHLLKGNHEAFVLRSAGPPEDPEDERFDLWRFAHWTATELAGALGEIAQWPDHLDLKETEGGTFHVTHGSRLGHRDGIHPETGDAELPAKLGDPRDLFIASHTHRPLLRRFDGTLLVNIGSVGQPFDGDSRAAYGRFVFRNKRWKAEIARVRYDKARTERDFQDSGFLDEGGPLVRLIQLELRQARPHLGLWMARHLRAVESGEVSVADAVARYLEEL